MIQVRKYFFNIEVLHFSTTFCWMLGGLGMNTALQQTTASAAAVQILNLIPDPPRFWSLVFTGLTVWWVIKQDCWTDTYNITQRPTIMLCHFKKLESFLT